MGYEVINTRTGKSVGVYESERTAKLRYNLPEYKVVKTDKPVNAFPVGIAIF